MDGPTFLMAYGAISATTCLVVRWANRQREPQADEPLPSVPSPADPYELAWLRGGTPEAIRLAVYELIQAGRLVSSRERGSNMLQMDPEGGDVVANTLAPLARIVLRACGQPRRPADLMRGTVAASVDEACSHWRLAHEEAGLLVTASGRRAAWQRLGAALLLLGGITLVRVCDSLAHGHTNLGFLVGLTVLGMVVLVRLGRPSRRLTARGRAYLDRLRSALAPTPAPQRREPEAARGDRNVADGLPAPAWSPLASAALVPVALYGMEAMAGPEQSRMQTLFPQAAVNGGTAGGCGSSSCGAAGSSSSGDDGGDSGGGGGCGGGGCGGGGD